jgi:uncharacterized membrane protein YfcA
MMVTFAVSGVTTYWWLPGLVAFVIAFFSSMGGLSGAFLLLPFQVSVLGFNTPAVTPTNQLYNVCAIPGGVFRYVREKRMVWPLSMATIIGTLPGLIIGAYMRVYLLNDPRDFKLFVGLVLLYIFVRLIIDIFRKAPAKNNAKPGTFNISKSSITLKVIEFCFEGVDYRVKTAYLFILALFVGVVGGAYGIGGGAIISPFMVAVLGLPVYAVAGAALMGTFVTSIAGVLIYAFLMPHLLPGNPVSNPDWLLGISMGAGGFIGIYLGARFQRYFAAQFIKTIIAVSIGYVVVKYVGGYFFKI